MIIVDRLWPTFLKSQDYRILREYGIAFNDEHKDFLDCAENYLVSWGENQSKIRHSVMETGFFWDGIHIDAYGLYERCSLNFPFAQKIIENFEAPKAWRTLNQEGKLRPKFNQSSISMDWDGVVVACQYPKDRSVWRAGSSGDYHRFLEEAAKHYGSKVFFKKHPVTLGNKEEMEFLDQLCLKYGSQCGYVNHSVMTKAESVLVYNSTFVVDALMAGKHVYQYAPGYFWQSGVVQYTNRSVCAPYQPIKESFVDKFVDFLIWKYCFHKLLPMDKLAQIIKTFATSNEHFPLPVELSYGYFINNP